MYDIYIYSSYAFTFLALGSLIAVSLIGCARARQRLAALKDAHISDA
jgi:heme exporter protein CcmD